MGEDIRLKDIFIGKSDGLSESARDDFEKLFYKGNNSYTSLVTDESKFIISGRKGTGKTILAKYYEKEQINKGMIASFSNANDVLLSQLIEIEGENLDNYKISAFVKYVIYYELAKLIIENEDIIIKNTKKFYRRKVKKKIRELKLFLEERNCASNYRIKQFTKESLEEFTSDTLAALNLSKSNFKSSIMSKFQNKKNQTYEKNPYYFIIDKLESFVKYLIKDTSVSLIFDDLDEYAEKINNNNAFQQLILKIIQVSYDINNQLNIAQKDKKSKILILIRSDILENLQTKASNLNKILSDSQIKINWITNDSSTEDNELMDLILTKIKNSSVSLRGESNKEIFHRFFPTMINNKSTGKYLIEMGHGRPRDIIDMLNIVKQKYKEEKCFKEYMFNQVAKEYSRNFIDSLKNEMSIYYSSEKINECFNLITFMKKDIFNIDHVVDTIEAYETRLSNIESGMEFVDITYRFGIIGNRIKHAGKNYTFFKYREDGHDLPDYHAKFIVHNGMKKTLL